MKIQLAALAAVSLGVAAFSQPSRTGFRPVPARPSFEGHFGLPLPATVKVIHYYGEDMPMDPSFAWELGPFTDTFLTRLVKKADLKRSPKGARPSAHTYRWPAWWKKARIEALPEVYYKDEGGLRRVWVDRPRKRLYVEWVNL